MNLIFLLQRQFTPPAELLEAGALAGALAGVLAWWAGAVGVIAFVGGFLRLGEVAAIAALSFFFLALAASLAALLAFLATCLLAFSACLEAFWVCLVAFLAALSAALSALDVVLDAAVGAAAEAGAAGLCLAWASTEPERATPAASREAITSLRIMIHWSRVFLSGPGPGMICKHERHGPATMHGYRHTETEQKPESVKAVVRMHFIGRRQ
jgi:hypothetical protein